MKHCIVIFILAICQLNSYSQSLIDKYKSGKVQLVPDKTFAQNNDWKVINHSYKEHDKTIKGIHFQTEFQGRKSLMKLLSGDILVNQYLRNPVIFSANGEFKKELNIDKSHRKTIIAQLDENTLLTEPEKFYKAMIYDLDCNYKKELSLGYSPIKTVSLYDNKLLVLGWEMLSGKPRYFVEIRDVKYNTYKILWEKHQKFDNAPFVYQWKWKRVPQPAEIITMPYAKGNDKTLLPIILRCKDDLIVAMPKTGEIHFYGDNGQLKHKGNISWQNDSLSVEEQKKIQQKAIEEAKLRIDNKHPDVMKNIDTYKKVISEMEEDLHNIHQPMAKPAFTNVIKDSDGNLLFFTIPKEKGANRFYVYVYNNNGEFKTECTFVCDEYDLSINSKKMFFDDGFIYSVQKLKDTDTNPYRLVRFELVSE
ncbi:MAG: hypothetical protein MI922_09670 [Bacteroidales bacterium]|nr:hypothetical protein [Bacteroidales bacterium]